MQYKSVNDLVSNGKTELVKGPVALIFAEDESEIDSTLRHHLSLGFARVCLFAPAAFAISSDLTDAVIRIDMDKAGTAAAIETINAVAQSAVQGTWFYYCFNAEYLFFPFCETRTVGEMLAFHTEERRDAMLTYVVDLYTGNLQDHADAVAIEGAMMDRSGYYALARKDPTNHDHPKERQLDFYGGLRWRYEEHVPAARRRIDRISLFRSRPDLTLRDDFTFDDEEYNTYACPWHNNLTAAVCSFRTAKALKRNPGSRFDVTDFRWHNSVPFEWHSRQLLDLGLMEPGQWF